MHAEYTPYSSRFGPPKSRFFLTCAHLDSCQHVHFGRRPMYRSESLYFTSFKRIQHRPSPDNDLRKWSSNRTTAAKVVVKLIATVTPVTVGLQFECMQCCSDRIAINVLRHQLRYTVAHLSCHLHANTACAGHAKRGWSLADIDFRDFGYVIASRRYRHCLIIETTATQSRWTWPALDNSLWWLTWVF